MHSNFLHCIHWPEFRVCLLLQFQGTVIAMLLAVGWLWSGAVRLRELRRVQAAARSRVLRTAAAAGGHADAVASAPQLPLPPPPLPLPPQQPGQLSRRGSHGSLAAQQHSTSAGGGVNTLLAATASSAASASISVENREQRPAAWPAVTVVLPVKGRRAHSGEAWASQLAMRYGETGSRVLRQLKTPGRTLWNGPVQRRHHATCSSWRSVL